MKIFNIFNFKKDKKRKLSPFYEVGFHGDKYLGEVVFYCLSRSEQYIETGFNVGSSLIYVCKNFPNLKIFSCEPDKEAFNSVQERISSEQKVFLFNSTSTQMIKKLHKNDEFSSEENTVFWLDAHSYGYDWPLKEEVSFIINNFKKGFIFIDDFKVPGIDDFKYFSDNGRECSFDYLKDVLDNQNYHLYYPNYKERTSLHHPLVGWGLIEFGQDNELNKNNNCIKNV